MTQAAASLKSSPRVELMAVTPSMAARWLEGANNRNRRLSDRYAERLARDIRHGRWKMTHEGIAFDPHGVLLDGQHRLWAIVLANRAVKLYVWLNVPPDALMAIDNGRPRSLADILTLGGGMDRVGNRELAVLRAMLGGFLTPPALTPAEAAEGLQRHREAIAFALTCLPRGTRFRGIASADSRAVIARAWYSADRERIAAFCEVLVGGMARREADRPAVLLWQFLLGRPAGGRAQRLERYAKTERALLAYLRGEAITRLYAATCELFPLPKEAAGRLRVRSESDINLNNLN
jgi:hypothetical protein